MYMFRTCIIQVERFESRLASAPIVCMDGNIPVETLQYICDVCHRNNVPGFFPLSLLFPPPSLSSHFLGHISGRLTNYGWSVFTSTYHGGTLPSLFRSYQPSNLIHSFSVPSPSPLPPSLSSFLLFTLLSYTHTLPHSIQSMV